MTDVSFMGADLPESWEVTTIGQVTSKVGSGATPRGGASVYLDEGPSFIRSQNVHDNDFNREGLAFLSDEAAHALRGVTVESGDVLMNITGDSILRTCMVPEDVLPARVNQHVAIIRSNGSVDARFLQKWLTLPAMKAYMLGHSSGGTRKAVTKGHILSFPIPLPPFPEQQGIADVLCGLDDKIASNRKAIFLATSLLDALAEQVAADLPLTRVANLGQINRSSVNPERLGSDLVDLFSLPAFDDYHWPERVPADAIMSNKLSIERPAILLSRLNPRFNRTWWAMPVEGVVALASPEFMCLSADSEAELAALWLAIRSETFMAELPRRVTGTSGSHQRVRPDDLLSIEAPDVRELDESVKAQALALLTLVHERRHEIVELAGLRELLLPELMTGRIRVPEAEITASASAALEEVLT